MLCGKNRKRLNQSHRPMNQIYVDAETAIVSYFDAQDRGIANFVGRRLSGMSKKSYKRNQNRLYREIKRRIIAEQALKFPVPVIETHRNIETLAIRNIVPNHLVREIEFVKMDMANKLARKLVAEGFVEFFSSENKYTPVTDAIEIEARINVVKPM